jgi:ABC-type Fe3+-siderophore transport system permease subunit
MNNTSQTGANSSPSGALLDIFVSAVPPAFTVPVIALKAFIPNLAGVFVLGCALAFAMAFQIALSRNPEWYRRVIENVSQASLMVITCIAWLLIINESGANEILNRYFLGNSVEDHSYVIRFVAGAIIVLRIATLGYQSTAKEENSNAKKETQAKHA